jgi:dihydropyrimidine dehydrogenase (NAD+) subunit PreT
MTGFADHKPALSAQQALVEACRCLFCSDAPCMKACPTGIDVAQFIRKIATGNLHGSARTIFDANILGMSCARVCPVEVLCEGACVLHKLGHRPIDIGRLQRHATDAAFEAGERFFTPGPDSGRRVALVGGGPASLAAAHELRRWGHRVTLFERRPSLGGLNATGVAPHKLRAERAREEAAWVLDIGGIEVKTGVTVGREMTYEALEGGFDAVFLGLGLGGDVALGVPGESLPGVTGALEWIEQLKLGRVDVTGVQRCLVVGGGNTAIDAAREARALGIAEVTLMYRGPSGSMGGYAHEWAAASARGVLGHWQAVPLAFEGDGRVQGVRWARTDARKQPVVGIQHTQAVDLVLVAVGRRGLLGSLPLLPGLRLEAGRLLTDADGYTGRPKWYAGGDCRNGGREVVDAVADGKRAARAIHAFLDGAQHG